MKIIQSFRRKGFRPFLILGLAVSLTSGTTWAATDSTTSSSSTPAKPAATSSEVKSPAAKSASTTTPASGSAKSATASSTPSSKKGEPASDKITTLPTIIVTAATRTSQPVDTTATTTTVLTNHDLDANKYANVPDALMSIPGLSVVTSGMPGAQTSVFVHGLEARQTLVMVDGRRQSSGFSGADDNLANLTLDNVDQIEVVRSPISTAQGGGAMGGVINLVSLSGKGVTTPEGSFSEEAGSFDTFKENAQSRGQVGNFDYAVSATRQDSIYPALSPGGPFGAPGFPGQADQYRNSTFRGNFGYQVTPDVYVDLHAAYNNAYTSSPNEFVFPDPTASLTIEDWNLSPEVVAKVTDFYTTKLYYTRDQQRLVDNDPFEAEQIAGFGESPQGFQSHEQLNTDSVDWQNDFQIASNWSVTGGFQGDLRNFYVDDNNLGRTLTGHDGNVGGYISSQWQPLTGLNVLTSGRYDAYSSFGGAFSWRQAVSYRVAPTQTLVHASVSRSFTPPSIQDLYFFSALGPLFPNAGLIPETDLGWEAGVEQPFLDNRVTPSLTYFHNDVHNDIEDVSIPGTFGAEITENVAKVTTDGVEVGLKVQPIPTVTLKGDYTYLNAVNDVTQMRLLRRPRNSVDFTGIWNPIAPLTLTMGGLWVVGREDADAITGAQEDAPDYFLLRASATYQINEHVSIWVRGENLTDRNYQPALGFYGPSMAAYGGIKVSF